MSRAAEEIRRNKDLSRNNLSNLGFDARVDLVVPITMEFVTVDIDPFKFFIGDFDTSLIGFHVEFGVNFQAG